jgi:hypothetical protein
MAEDVQFECFSAGLCCGIHVLHFLSAPLKIISIATYRQQFVFALEAGAGNCFSTFIFSPCFTFFAFKVFGAIANLATLSSDSRQLLAETDACSAIVTSARAQGLNNIGLNTQVRKAYENRSKHLIPNISEAIPQCPFDN